MGCVASKAEAASRQDTNSKGKKQRKRRNNNKLSSSNVAAGKKSRSACAANPLSTPLRGGGPEPPPHAEQSHVPAATVLHDPRDIDRRRSTLDTAEHPSSMSSSAQPNVAATDVITNYVEDATEHIPRLDDDACSGLHPQMSDTMQPVDGCFTHCSLGQAGRQASAVSSAATSLLDDMKHSMDSLFNRFDAASENMNSSASSRSSLIAAP